MVRRRHEAIGQYRAIEARGRLQHTGAMLSRANQPYEEESSDQSSHRAARARPSRQDRTNAQEAARRQIEDGTEEGIETGEGDEVIRRVRQQT